MAGRRRLSGTGGAANSTYAPPSRLHPVLRTSRPCRSPSHKARPVRARSHSAPHVREEEPPPGGTSASSRAGCPHLVPSWRIDRSVDLGARCWRSYPSARGDLAQPRGRGRRRRPSPRRSRLLVGAVAPQQSGQARQRDGETSWTSGAEHSTSIYCSRHRSRSPSPDVWRCVADLAPRARTVPEPRSAGSAPSTARPAHLLLRWGR